jgi:hypothetical protein
MDFLLTPNYTTADKAVPSPFGNVFQPAAEFGI